MKVTINHKYCYETGQLKVKVGDRVVLPSAIMRDSTWEGYVTDLKGEWNGPCSYIIAVRKREKIKKSA